MKQPRTTLIIGTLIIAGILLSMSLYALNMNTIRITTTNITTIVDLDCEINVTGQGTLTANYTWYNGTENVTNGTLVLTSGVSSTVTLDSSYTTKGETWKCGVVVTNGSATIAQNSTPQTIENALPQMTFPTTNQTAYEDQAFGPITATAHDPDGDSVTWFSIDKNATQYGSALFTIQTDGTISFTPEMADIGNHTMLIIADDDEDTGGKNIVWKVLEVNDDPQFNPALSNHTATEGITYSFTINITDEENDFPINFTWYADNPNITITNISGHQAQINFTHTDSKPGFGDRGNWTIYVNISDQRGGNATDNFTLEVLSVNNPPVLGNISNQTGTQGDNLTFYFNATDIDGDELIFTTNDSLYSSNLTILDNTSTNATGMINITQLNNSHVVQRWLNITVDDSSGGTDSQVVFINITNTNDAPVINNASYYANNTQPAINTLIHNLTAFANVAFLYRVNATDPDQDTYQGEILSFSTNDTDFPITAIGVVNFTINDSRNISLNITVTDDEGANVSALMNITVLNNTIPYFNHSLTNQNCSEDVPCVYDINATDDDGDTITYGDNTSLFNISNTTGLISFTPNQSQIGNYSIKITITDQKGASNHSNFTLFINNTNDAPVLNTIYLPRMVVNHHVQYTITATDQDLNLPAALQYDNLTFYAFNQTNSSVINLSLTGLINVTPSISHIGNHSYNFTVNDTYGAEDSIIINFTVYPESLPPNISQIYPYGSPISNDTVVYGWWNRTGFPLNVTSLTNISENTTVTFNHSTTDDNLTGPLNLTYTWYIDGVKVTNSSELSADNHTLTTYFDFFSSNKSNVSLLVKDDLYENSSFVWNLSITNTNRAPIIHNNPDNLTNVVRTETHPHYFVHSLEPKILDPDDDLNQNGQLDSSETNHLTYTISSCSKATLTVVDTDYLQVVPAEIGACYVIVNASDGQYSVLSDPILINVTEVPEQETTTITSGGGGSSTTTITLPVPIDVEVPVPLEILVPSAITIYENDSISIPIALKNNWDETLNGISLSAEFNVTNVSYAFGDDYFPQLTPLATYNTTLELWGYRLGENFEVKIIGNVTEPETNDTATVLINSLEQSSKGQAVKTKVTFARELMENNPECLELNEILKRAVDRMNQRDYTGAELMVDAVIQGCKHLIEKQKEKEEEQPKDWKRFFRFGNEYISGTLMVIGAILVILISIGVFVRIKKAQRKRPEGKKIDY